MSGTFPTSPGPGNVNLTSNQPTIVSMSESGRRQSRIQAGHLWKARLTWPVMQRSGFAPIFAFAMSQRGRFEDFQIVLPNHSTPQGVATGTPLVVGIHAVGATSISTDGWTNSITGIVKAGDILKFANHSKVYMIMADANSGVTTGPATISINPPLVKALSDNEAITINNVPFTMAFESDPTEWKGTSPSLASYSASLIESIT